MGFNNGFCIVFTSTEPHSHCTSYTYPITFTSIPYIIGKFGYIDGYAECYLTNKTISTFSTACNIRHCSFGNYLVIGSI